MKSTINDLLLVGSVPLETAEEVFRAVARPLGRWLPYIPDGEIGERQWWVDGFAHRVLTGHPELETIARPAPDAGGIERWKPRGLHDDFKFRVKPGVERVRFGDPGWRLGYARDALNSYFVFKTLRAEGVIPEGVRFQVCMPFPYSAVAGFLPDPADVPKIIPGLSEAFREEVAMLTRKIPAQDLAIQWDLAVENRFLEAKVSAEGVHAARPEADRMLDSARVICSDIPTQVHLGYHSCFGTLNGWPSRQPASLAGTVMLLNAAVAASGRPVNFLHFPTVGSADEHYFAPLADLQSDGARVYVGAIHHLHKPGGLRRQLELSQQHLGEFGIAAPCGFGRATERPGGMSASKGPAPAETVLKSIVADHVAAIEVLEAVRNG